MSLRMIVAGLAVVIVAVTALSGAVLAAQRGRPSAAPIRGVSDEQGDRPGVGTGAATLRPDTTLPSDPPVVGGPGVQVTPPQLIAIAPAKVSLATLRKIAKLRHVEKVASADGGSVRVSGTALQLLAVDPAQFRSWTPKGVAEHPEVWNALAHDEFVADATAVRRLGLVLGAQYQLDGGPRLRVAASASFGLPGIDGLIGRDLGRRLGFSSGVVVLVHGDSGTLDPARVGRLLGPKAQVVRVGPEPAKGTPSRSPAPPAEALVGRPDSYLELYQRAAAVCPGLSWTVLAAIGQVESGHGRNNGPSSAGALGPMQFMPSTWKAYGVDGDGDGDKDIWSPYDAVPAASRYLCANGAGRGGDKLRKAVWFYNHSWDYVNNVLSLADAYARTYS
ncbi:lytic transglycosylase domain-containing protein [Microbispora sp. RL4-1S]|uniref:Lytic transglycosylase domain-containing protein n=2 Tax=Microbispora oryzae TaxID=2806554 RepID=A0A941ALB2_9ACTN|nr:lytic transglycosylase domain-containing protein [Microbispora oryzae]